MGEGGQPAIFQPSCYLLVIKHALELWQVRLADWAAVLVVILSSGGGRV